MLEHFVRRVLFPMLCMMPCIGLSYLIALKKGRSVIGIVLPLVVISTFALLLLAFFADNFDAIREIARHIRQ